MRLIPIKVRDQALWEFDNFKEDPGRLRTWLRTKARLLQTVPASAAHVLEQADELEDGGDGDENGFTQIEDIIAAVQKLQQDGCDADLVTGPGGAPARSARARHMDANKIDQDKLVSKTESGSYPGGP